MSWGDDLYARNVSTANAAKAAPTDAGTYVKGLVQSATSGLMEMIGQTPTPEAERFRAENPVMGFVSEVAPSILPYGAMHRISELPKAAALLEGTLAKTGLTEAANPIAHGALKEVLRYAPLEMGRLGIGLSTQDGQDNWGNLLADVGLSTALMGGFGGIGGYLRAGGKVVAPEAANRVVGADMAFAPFAELRAARRPDAALQLGGDITNTIADRTVQVFKETPETSASLRKAGIKGSYIENLDGGTLQQAAEINSLFKVRSGPGLQKQKLLEGLPDDPSTLNAGEQSGITAALGFDDPSAMAENLRFPRRVVISSPAGAGTFWKRLSNGALKDVGNGTWMGREENGLFVLAKRLKAGEEGSAIPKAGDEWLMFKTDRPNLFVPDAAKVNEATVANWARYRPGYQPSLKAGPIDASMNTLNDVLSPQDFNDLKNPAVGKQVWITRKASDLAKKFGEAAGVRSTETTSRLANWLYDVAKPAMFQEVQNPIFGRLFANLSAAMRSADDITNTLMGGRIKTTGSLNKAVFRGGYEFVGGLGDNAAVRKTLAEIPKEDYTAFHLARTAELPQQALEELVANGAIRPETVAAIEKLQKVNRDYIEQVFTPAIKGTSLEKDFRPLEGYFGPRDWPGEFRTPVLDGSGRQIWLGGGKTLPESKAIAQAYVDEAVSRGMDWKLGKTLSVAKEGADSIAAISDEIGRRLSMSNDLQDVIEKASTKLIMAKAGQKAPRVLTKAGFMEKRTGVSGVADIPPPDMNDVADSLERHYKSMSKLAAYHAWRQRWLPEAFNLQKLDPTLHDNLMRKANQFVGLEGTITKEINNTLKPIFGNSHAGTQIAREANKLMTAWNLSIANPTFGIVNLLQPLQTVAPWISFMTHAPTEVAEKYMGVGLRMDAEGKVRGSLSMLHPMKVMGQAIKEMSNPRPELRQMIEQLKQEGLVSSHIHEEWLGSDSAAAMGIRESFKKQGAWGGISKIATYMANKSEEFSRVVSANAAYLLGKEHFGLEGDKLLQFVRQGVRVTNYGYSVVDRSRMFTGPVGSVFGLFKNWQMNYIGQMMQYAGLGIHHNEWGPLLWQLGSALAVGGLGATPLKVMADGLARWHDGKDSNSYLWLQDHWQGHGADEIYFGLPAFLGVSLQSSATTPGTDVGKDAASLMNIVAWERAKALGKAVGGAWNQYDATGQNPLRDSNVRDQLIGAAAPRAIFRAVSATEGDYVKSMATGYPSVRGVSPVSKMLYAMGLNQVDIDREQVISNQLWKQQEVLKSEIQGLGKAFAQAQLNQDFDETTRIAQLAMARGVPISSIVQSANTIIRREQTGDLMSKYDKGLVQRYRTAGAGGD